LLTIGDGKSSTTRAKNKLHTSVAQISLELLPPSVVVVAKRMVQGLWQRWPPQMMLAKMPCLSKNSPENYVSLKKGAVSKGRDRLATINFQGLKKTSH